MLRRIDQGHALALVCNESGHVVELLSDARGFLSEGVRIPDISVMMRDDCRPHFLKFLREVLAQGHALLKEIVLVRGGREFAFCVFGIMRHGRIFLLAVQSPQQMFLIYDEFMAMINEQARALREAQKKSTQCNVERRCAEDKGLLEDFMKLNNELANMQRDLAIAHRTLQNQEKLFRDLVIFNPDAQLVLSPEGKILFFNPAAEEMLGLSTEESIGSVFPLDVRQEKEFCLRSDRGRVCAEIKHTQVSWENEPATLVSLRDITERKQMEQLKEDIGRILQHDLISPLNPVISLPQLLADDGNLTEDQKQMLMMISKAGNRMLEMIRLTLNLYKMEHGSYAFTRVPVDLLATFRDILADLSERIRAKKVFPRIMVAERIAWPRETFWVMAEPTLCYSMFSNLIVNSIEASPQNGVVTVLLRHETADQISVHNFGTVPRDIRSSFFEKYVTSGKAHGTGLGTYSAKLIATTLGGNIRMETSEESGTTLTVELPVSMDVRQARPETVHERQDETNTIQEDLAMGKTLKMDPELHAALAELKTQVELHSFDALAQARALLGQCQQGTAEWSAVSGIAKALAGFDFSTAKSMLGDAAHKPRFDPEVPRAD